MMNSKTCGNPPWINIKPTSLVRQLVFWMRITYTDGHRLPVTHTDRPKLATNTLKVIVVPRIDPAPEEQIIQVNIDERIDVHIVNEGPVEVANWWTSSQSEGRSTSSSSNAFQNFVYEKQLTKLTGYSPDKFGKEVYTKGDIEDGNFEFHISTSAIHKITISLLKCGNLLWCLTNEFNVQ